MLRATHTCTYCSRNFKRAEHLTRHLRTHTREKPYSCRCGANFTRRDLLTRHWRISKHAGQGYSLNGEHLVHAASPVCSEIQVPASEHNLATPAVTSIVSIDTQQDVLAHPINGDFHESVPIFDRTASRIDNLDPSIEAHEDPSEDFRDFINFIDGVGLSAQWTPEFNFDWIGVDDNSRESRRSSCGPRQRLSPGAEDIGTPFSTWLPSAPADNQIHLRCESGDDLRDKVSKNGPFRVTEEQRIFLVSLLKGFQNLDPTFDIPSRHTLTRYITAFFGGFHSHFPFIHAPTFKPTCSPLELTLAICATGAQYCFERRSAERLYHMSKAIVFERLHQEQSLFGPQTLSIVALSSPLVELDAQRLGPWAPLDLAKTLLILVGFGTWERKELLEQSFCLRDLLVHVLRDIGLEEKEILEPATTSPSARWDRWIQKESTRRTKLVAFTYINVHSVAYNVRPSLWISELHLQLPCRTADWQANSAAQWIALTRDEHEPQMLFQQALSILLSGTSGTQHFVQPIPSPIGNYILLHALLQRIQVIRELSYSTMSPASVSVPDLQAITRALRSWTSLWQQAPESILDPNNESGPIPFTSSALLVVAYIRLSLNVGPHRHLALRDTKLTSAELSKIPDIEHNDNLLSALLYSTHALSIPVRLGIDRVARSQAFFWSVQHAVSSFECAVFLSKWLCSLPKVVNGEHLTRSEQRILHWVRCIIKEAYAVIDFDEQEAIDAGSDRLEDPHSLGLSVLKIWCRFFRGNTQWQFVVNLGLSLECYMDATKATLP